MNRYTKAILYLSVEDNVLEEEDWPILQLEINEYGRVIEKRMIRTGAHELDPQKFNSLQDIATWLEYVPAEDDHPQIFHVLVTATPF